MAISSDFISKMVMVMVFTLFVMWVVSGFWDKITQATITMGMFIAIMGAVIFLLYKYIHAIGAVKTFDAIAMAAAALAIIAVFYYFPSIIPTEFQKSVFSLFSAFGG